MQILVNFESFAKLSLKVLLICLHGTRTCPEAVEMPVEGGAFFFGVLVRTLVQWPSKILKQQTTVKLYIKSKPVPLHKV